MFRVLNEMGVEYMLTGSYASNIYGRVRSTFDADFVITLHALDVSRLIQSLGEDFYFDASSLQEIEQIGGQFNVIHKPSGLKIDFYLPRNSRDREALGRRRSHLLWGQTVWTIAPEDLILSKLVWAKSGGSARQIEDARGIYEIQKERLDTDFLKSRARDLSVSDSLEQVLQ